MCRQSKRLGLKKNTFHSQHSKSIWISHPPFYQHTQESQWSLPVWQCQQSVQCQPERPQVSPTATGFSSSCSMASYPRMCILKDCVRNREIKPRNVTLAHTQKKTLLLQLWPSSILTVSIMQLKSHLCH